MLANRAVEQTEWVLAQQAFPEAHREAAERFWQFTGSIAVRGEAELMLAENEVNQSTLLSALQRARMGDADAYRAARMNVSTDAAERMFKVAHQSSVQLEFTDHRLVQHGIYLTDVHRNTMEHTVLIPEMQRRTNHETKNVMLFEALHARGVLEQYDALVFSPSSTNMTDQQKKDYGLFLDTESCSIQLLSAQGNKADLQTAFVAGKATASSDRHDLQAIKTLARKQGLQLELLDGTDAIQYLMLVPKGSFEHGVTDVVRLYDEAIGDNIFYGQAGPEHDYVAYAAQCNERNQRFDAVVEAIMDQLLAEAHLFTSPLEAIMRLDEISERLCVKYSVSNRDINARVFGSTAAAHIEAARHELENGDQAAAEKHMVKAQNTADSGSCPLFKGARNQAEAADGTANESDDKKGKRMMHCPYCSARVYDDPCARVLSCWDCKARVVNGQVRSKGDGGSKARAAKAAAARREAEKAAQARQEAEMQKQVDEVFNESDIDEAAFATQSIGHAKSLQPA